MPTKIQKPSKAAAKSIDVSFNLERETKNTYRFQEDTESDPVIGTLYIQKSAFGTGSAPASITVGITL